MSYANPRITLTDDLVSAIYKLNDGVPGCAAVLMKLAQQSPTIDPDDAFGHFGPLMMLDTCGIYGHRILHLYKDICDQNVLHMLAVLRAAQLGIVNVRDVLAAIDGAGGIDTAQILLKVQKVLPEFGVAA